MPNLKLETYKNKATGDVYDFTDAAAQAALAGILDGTDIDSFGDVETALADKVDKVTGKGLSTNDYDNTEKAKVAGAFPRSEQAVLGAKNLFAGKYTTQTVGEVTFTANSDNTVTAVNSEKTVSSRQIESTRFVAPFDAQVKLSGGIDANHHLYPWDYTRGSRPYTNSSKTTLQTLNCEEFPISFWMEKGHEYAIDCRVYGDTSAGEVVFKPMITLESDTDLTFAPHAMTNKELTELTYKKQGSALIETYTFAENISSDAAAVARAGYIIMHTLRLIVSANIEANTVVITDGLGYAAVNIDMSFNTVFRTSAGDEYKMSIVTVSGGKVQLKTLTAIPNGTQLRGSIIFISQ